MGEGGERAALSSLSRDKDQVRTVRRGSFRSGRQWRLVTQISYRRGEYYVSRQLDTIGRAPPAGGRIRGKKVMASIEVLRVMGFDARGAAVIESGGGHFELMPEDNIFAFGIEQDGTRNLYSVVYQGEVQGGASFNVFENDQMVGEGIAVAIDEVLILSSDEDCCDG